MQSYNFFGMGPGQQQAPVDPMVLALQQYNNPTSSQASQSNPSPSIDPKALAKMMMPQQQPNLATSPSGAEGMGPFQLPWLNGGGNG